MIIRPVLAFLALSTFATAKEPAKATISVGKPAPDFTVTGKDGGEIKLSDFRGKSHLVVVFGRAHW